MGNVLETDSDASDSEPSEVEKGPVRIGPRTDGDGMESTEPNSMASKSDVLHDPPEVETSPSASAILDDITEIHNLFQAANNQHRLKNDGNKKSVVSPKTMPPKNLLIPVKTQSNNIFEDFTKCPPKKTLESLRQKAPKFVPYEPYAGAVRPITLNDVSSPCLSRKTSKSSLRSRQASTGDVDVSGEGENLVEVAENIKAFQLSSKLKNNATCSSQYASSFEVTPSETAHHKSPKLKVEGLANQTSSGVTALKERLKVAEKDVTDLRNENTRLKKMLVDTMSGGAAVNIEEIASPLNPTLLAVEKADHLADNIEVWRSKFLSSCILVEQLSKDNHQYGEHLQEASDIFRSMKHEGTLSPTQFEIVNTWLRKAELLSKLKNEITE